MCLLAYYNIVNEVCHLIRGIISLDAKVGDAFKNVTQVFLECYQTNSDFFVGVFPTCANGMGSTIKLVITQGFGLIASRVGLKSSVFGPMFHLVDNSVVYWYFFDP